MSKKDSYWFRHDSTAGRGLRMRKMAHIYGHWGKGIYWDVIEILRDQTKYSFHSDDTSLQMLCDLIGCKDEAKFISWFKDCINLDLFQQNKGKFYSEILCKNMLKWDTSKANGDKGGRPPKPKRNPTNNPNETIIEEDSIEEEKRRENNTEHLAKILFAEMKKFFLEEYKKKTTTDYYWGPKDAKNLKELINKIKFKIQQKEKTLGKKEKENYNEDILTGFKHLILSSKDKWINAQFSIPIFNSKFNEIFTQILTNNGKPVINARTMADAVEKEFATKQSH